MKDDEGEFDAATLRELSYFTLAGAQIFASDTLYLPRSLTRLAEPAPGSRWAATATTLVTWAELAMRWTWGRARERRWISALLREDSP